MKLAVARLIEGQPRFFAGDYNPELFALAAPVCTAQPDLARVYDHRVVAQLVADLFNVADGFRTGVRSQPWSVVELPECWQ